MSFDTGNPNVSIPRESLSEVLEIVLNGGSGADIYRAGVKNSKGKPVSERQGRRYRREAEQLIDELPPEVVSQFVDGAYQADEVFGVDEDTAYPPVVAPKVMNRTAVFDIEVLSPSFNRMGKYSHFLLCASFLPLDTGEVYTLEMTFEDRNDDRRLLRDVINEVSKYQFIIGHNVKKYDINWLMTRAMFYGWPTPKRLFYYDTYSALRRVPLLHKKSLGDSIDFFRIQDAEKTKIMPIEWDRIRSPHKKDFENEMDEIVYHCTTPDHKTLMSDLTWKPIGSLSIGDKIVAFEEESQPQANGRKYKESTIENIIIEDEEVFAVALSNGDIIKTTRDHRWIKKNGNGLYWTRTDRLQPEKTHNKFSTKLPKFFNVWEEDSSYKAGWLSGIFDGEGTLSTHHTLFVSQRPGSVLEKIDINAFGRLESRNEEPHVVEITSLGVMPVAKVKTSTGTLFVDGYAMHNCENDVIANRALYDILIGLEYDPKPSWKLWPH